MRRGRGPYGSTGTRVPPGQTITIVDLPGTYSLSAYSAEEEIARDFIVDEHPHLVINVVDAANIERNLYLTAQILETGVPLIIVLNMLDQAEAHGIQIDVTRLSESLGQDASRPAGGQAGARDRRLAGPHYHAGWRCHAEYGGMTVMPADQQQRPAIFEYAPAIEAEIGLLRAAIRTVPPLAADLRSALACHPVAGRR